MPDWTSSMQQTFEYYTVNPITWKDEKRLTKVKSSSIDWDSSSKTLCSATIELDDDINECYIRIYLITIQNGITEKHPLGTFLVQTLPTSFDGKKKSFSVDAYSPLLELNEKYPPLGYYIVKDKQKYPVGVEYTNIMDIAYKLTKENLRAPVVKPSCDKTLYDHFVSDPNDTYLTLITDLMANAKYSFGLDELGKVIFVPQKKIEAMQPIWTYTDDNSSILYPDIDMDRDLYGIPNVVEVFASNGTDLIHSVIENNDINSPTSIKNRGRRIVHRDNDPEITGIPSEKDKAQAYVDEYAKALLAKLSSLEHTITYKHGYCPVRIGDCIRINSERFGLNNVKARVISQNIKCTPGCPVTEKAVYTTKLWLGDYEL